MSPNETDYLLQLPTKNILLEAQRDEKDKFASISKDYIQSQKVQLFENWKEAIYKYSKSYEIMFNECIPNDTGNIINLSNKIHFPDNILNVFEKMVNGLDEFIKDTDLINILKGKIYSYQEEDADLDKCTVLEKITGQIYGENPDIPKIKEYLRDINYTNLTSDFFESLFSKVEEIINQIDNFSSLAKWETALFEFCKNNGVVLSNKGGKNTTTPPCFISLVENIYNKEELEHIKLLKSIINNYSSELTLSNDFKLIILGNDSNYDSKIKSYGFDKLCYKEFNYYIIGKQINAIDIFAILDNNVPAIEINDKTPDGLIFTKYGIGKIKNKVDKNKTKVKKEVSKFVIPYNKVEFKNGSLYIGSKKYLAENYIDTSKLYGLIQELKNKI